MMADEIPERDFHSSTVPTDLTITESTISSSDVVNAAGPKFMELTGNKSSRGRHAHQTKFGEQSGAGDRRSSMKNRNLEDRYNDLLQEVNEIRVTQVTQVSALESELKLKSYELKQSQQQNKSLQSQLKTNLKEKTDACVKVKSLTEKLSALRKVSDQEICNLNMSLHEKTLKLEMYEKIQTKIDHVLFPDLPVSDTAVNDTDVEGILFNFGYGNISVDAKLRLQQSLDLAKRLSSERDHLEKNRDDMQLKLNEVEKKYHQLLIELNHLKLSDKCQMSELQSELKLKKFELERLSILYSEVNEKYKDTLLEKERLAEKLDVLREEFANSQSSSAEKISSLTVRLQEKTTRLETYDKLEAELDNVVVQAATLPNEEDAEQILAAYGYRSSIPCNLKRRLEQSLKLARRVLELEHINSEQKKELFANRDRNVNLKQELDILEETLKLSGHPTAELLQVIQKRDLIIAKLHENIKQLDLTITKITSSNMELQGKISQLDAKLSEATKPRTSCIYKRYTANQSQSVISSGPYQSSSGRRGLSVSFKGDSDSQGAVSSLSRISFSDTPSSSASLINIKKPLSFSKLRFEE